MIEEMIKRALRYELCDRCLGRLFAQLLTQTNNEERGRVLRTYAAMLLDAGEISADSVNHGNFPSSISLRNVRLKQKKRIKCYLCKGLMNRIDAIAEKVVKKLSSYEFSSFLIGTKLSQEFIDKEEEIWQSVGIEFCEPLKAEINREVGKIVKERMKKEYDPKKPDILVVLNVESERKISIELNVRSLYIFGLYRKLVRNIPQCKWPDKRYRTSVEQIIGKPLLKATRAKETRFHGCGREDIDARCLAWRPFVIELVHPKRRSVELEKIQELINSSKKVEVRLVKPVDSSVVKMVKLANPDKAYRALVVLDKPVKKEDLKKLKELEGRKIRQWTPTRVLHRRSDRLRVRVVKEIDYAYISPRSFELYVKCSAGLYVKELVSGDGGRTTPSVSEILGVNARVKELDVTWIDLKPFAEILPQDYIAYKES